ncbi:MAG: hypothetical protein H8K07_21340 [Nitrospira sp.]|jgi:hypothetical protein|nr:hypothetical protein [Nitrospira sp.]MDI3463498.1 hypothetical protein [Nitrospira sp.]
MMKTVVTTRNGVVLMVVMFVALSIQSTPPVQAAADSHVERTMVFVPKEERGVPIGERAVMAPGAVEDTLKACRARIPELASAGQRMLAEQSCVGEEKTRKAIRSAPKF